MIPISACRGDSWQAAITKKEAAMTTSTHPASEAARAQRGREETTQVALETVAEGGPLAGVLEFLCRTMEDESLDRVIACIHPLNEDASMFVYAAAPSLDKSYREAVEGMLVSSMTGPCCQAVATRQTYVVPEVAVDRKIVKFREFADPLGIRSAWCTPIFSSEGKVLGTFAHYYFEARDPSPRDARMVELLTRDAGIAIERNRAEAALRTLNETLEQRVQAETRERLHIWNVSQDLLVIAGLDGTYLSVNPAWTATLGWSEADLLGKSYQWLLHPDDRESTRAELDHLAEGHKTLRFENRLRARDGSYHWISWKAAPDSGRIYSTGRDITEHKRAEGELQQARIALAHRQRVSMLGEVAASLAHEIRQPIAAAQIDAEVCVQALTDDRLDLQAARAAASRLVKEAMWGDEIIKRTTALYKKETTQRERVDINALIREMAMLLQQEASASSIAIRTDLAEGFPDIMADRIQLQQVLMNLMLNAIEAMTNTGGELTVTSQLSEDSELLIAVRDTGVGLPAENPNQIFESFVTTKPHGTGMGLAITRSIVESHGGRLWAIGNTGPGATFLFTLLTDAGEQGPSRQS
jgi:PAS domain S-box-containing protein